MPSQRPAQPPLHLLALPARAQEAARMEHPHRMDEYGDASSADHPQREQPLRVHDEIHRQYGGADHHIPHQMQVKAFEAADILERLSFLTPMA